MSFIITGLPVERFSSLFGLADEALAIRGVQRHRIQSPRSAPCRITLQDAEPGETVLLLNHEHQDAPTPYRSSHAIYVREAAREARVLVDETPDAFLGRTLSLRLFDGAGMMVDADLCEGAEAPGLIERLLAKPSASYVHAHTARRGCFLARIDRAWQRDKRRPGGYQGSGQDFREERAWLATTSKDGSC